jgi:flagellar biosynthesis protein FlhF
MSTASALLEQAPDGGAPRGWRRRPQAAEPGPSTFPVQHRPASRAPLSQSPADGTTRVYRGRSIDELIPRIEAELGADAIVVRRKRGLEGGIGGFFQRPFVEVEAKPGTPRFDMYDEGMGEPVLPPPPTPAPAVPRPAGSYVTNTLATIAAASSPEPVVEDPPRPSADLPAEFHELTPDTFASALIEAEQALPAPAAPAPTPSPVPDPIGDELDLLDREMRELQVIRPRTTEVSSAPLHGRARMGIEKAMLGVGVSEELTGELIDAAIAHALPFAPRISLAKAVHGAVVTRIPRVPLLPARSAAVAVIGPGGSGKTCCCAALLGAYRRAGALPASCATITLVGEREEPAMLLSPQIMEPEALTTPRARQALAQAREDGLLLLDMPPLSPADRSLIRQMASVLGVLKPDRVVVALPATLGAQAAAQLLEALRPLGATAMVITHADETDQIGVAVEAACRFGLAPEYLLDRGRVRGGLSRIDPTHLADRLLP